MQIKIFPIRNIGLVTVVLNHCFCVCFMIPKINFYFSSSPHSPHCNSQLCGCSWLHNSNLCQVSFQWQQSSYCWPVVTSCRSESSRWTSNIQAADGVWDNTLDDTNDRRYSKSDRSWSVISCLHEHHCHHHSQLHVHHISGFIIVQFYLHTPKTQMNIYLLILPFLI